MNNFNSNSNEHPIGAFRAECSLDQGDRLICHLHKVIRFVARILAVLMTLVILWGIGDIVYVLYNKLMAPPFMLLEISDIFATFGAFLAVMIAIEIFLNITLFLRDDVIHVRVVIATALMAIARKVIVFDYKVLPPEYIWATSAVILALGITYWIVMAMGGD
jgi:uncharacterized membrane protein (DUF373 family)